MIIVFEKDKKFHDWTYVSSLKPVYILLFINFNQVTKCFNKLTL